MCHAKELLAAPQSLGRSLVQLFSGLGSQLIADHGSQQHLLRDTRSNSAGKQLHSTMYTNRRQLVSDLCSYRW